jgi:CBS domain containing-hemolysin-like protein
MVMIHKIAEVTGLPLLAVEAGFLLLLTIIFVIVVLLVLAIFRIKNEIIKMSYTTNYITRLIERGYKDRKLYKVNYDLKTEQIILDLLQEGKSHAEIIKNIYVSEEYVEIIERLAEEEGLLPKKTDENPLE